MVGQGLGLPVLSLPYPFFMAIQPVFYFVLHLFTGCGRDEGWPCHGDNDSMGGVLSALGVFLQCCHWLGFCTTIAFTIDLRKITQIGNRIWHLALNA